MLDENSLVGHVANSFGVKFKLHRCDSPKCDFNCRSISCEYPFHVRSITLSQKRASSINLPRIRRNTATRVVWLILRRPVRYFIPFSRMRLRYHRLLDKSYSRLRGPYSKLKLFVERGYFEYAPVGFFTLYVAFVLSLTHVSSCSISASRDFSVNLTCIMDRHAANDQ